MERHFDLEFPNANSLSMKYYENDKYNDVRRCKLILFSHCIGHNDKFLQTHLKKEIDKKRKKETNKFLLLCNVPVQSIDIINEYLYHVYSTKEDIVKYLERGCLMRSIEKAKTHNIRCVWSNDKFVSLYHSICYKVSSNLDPNSCIQSDYILKKIFNNDVNLVNIANMTSKELCPKKYEQISEKVNKRTNFERKVKFSEMYRCRKCKRNQTTTERRYNRSWDEGVNLTIHCLFCGYSWCA